MSYKKILDDASNNLEAIILQDISDATMIPTKDYGWSNKRYISDLFRMAHIERYNEKTLDVLHFTCFPHVTCGNPIFGFDIITTEKKPLAAFLDWSPVENDIKLETNLENFGEKYNLPDWTTSIFSPTAIGVIPQDMNDVQNMLTFTISSFKNYISLLSNCYTKSDKIELIVNKQNFYCEQQQQNKRTFNVLKAKLGEDGAKEFMETILFPKFYITL